MHGVREYGKDFTFSELTYADLKGLAPLLIQVGAAETLLGDAIRLAKAAGAADVRVDLQIWPEMVHVWHMFHPELKGREAGDPGGRRLHSRASDGAVASSNSGRTRMVRTCFGLNGRVWPIGCPLFQGSP